MAPRPCPPADARVAAALVVAIADRVTSQVLARLERAGLLPPETERPAPKPAPGLDGAP